MKTENLVGQLKGEFDVQTTFEGDNNVLMQQVRKAKEHNRYCMFLVLTIQWDLY